MEHNRKLILENGDAYEGYLFGSDRNKVCELVFNTSMVGYQEIISDPSYTYQAVVMTYPLIGNYGINDEDYESVRPSIGALIVREYNDEPSNFRCTETLGSVMKRFGISGISGIDTRKLTRHIRDYGSCKVLITDISTSAEEGMKILENTEVPRDAVSLVSRKDPMTIPSSDSVFRVAAIDCGIKMNIVRSLAARGCDVTVFPWNAGPEEIEQIRPDGIFISNGPGDPEDVPETISTIRSLIGRYPIFGICLGHQIISLAYGAKTYKLKFGHRGGNHPVKNLETGKIEITSQNHSYAVDSCSIAGTPLEVTHVNLLDGTIEGVRCRKDRVFSVQYHPESAPGPQDSAYLFDRFLGQMREVKFHAKKD